MATDSPPYAGKVDVTGLREALRQDEDLLRALMSAHTASLDELQRLFGHLQASRRMLALGEQVTDAEQGAWVPFR